MTPARVGWALGALSLALAAAAISAGPLATLLTAPLILCAAALCASALHPGRGLSEESPQRVVGIALAAAIVGAVLWMTGAGAAGFLTLASGLGVAWAGARLSLGFAVAPQGRVLPPPELPLAAGVAADELVKLGWELTRRAAPPPDYERIAADVRSAVDRNRGRGWLDHPRRAHLPPPPLEKRRLVTTHVRGVGPVEHLSFTSEFEPQDPEIRDSYLALRRNRTAHVYLWRDRRQARPTLLCIHGYGMGRVAFDARAWDVGWLQRRLGLDLALVVLPLHGPRSAGRRSGAGFLDGHPLWTNAALGQAVWELRRLTGWLRAQGAPTVGVFGMSLGGYTAALLASVEEGLACAVAAVPATSLADLVWRQMPARRRAEARSAGLTPQLLDNAWARHSPLRLRPRVPHEARLVIGGLADRIIEPAQVEALWNHWGRPALHWYPGTHLAWLGRRDLRALLDAHLRQTLLA